MTRWLLTWCAMAVTMSSAWAEGTVSIVVPNRPGVPIIINGIDASYAVVEGDWGLARGIHVQPTIYGGRYVYDGPHVGRYFPSGGQVPGYGRLEIEPPARPAQRAESYFRSYSAQSAPPRSDAPPLVIEQSGDDRWSADAPPMRRPGF